MSGVALDWLRLRERADLAARDPGLARRFAGALRPAANAPVHLIDLGAGSGANCRALLPRIAGDQDWSLIERDRTLVAAQGEEFTLWARRQGYPILAGGGRIAIDARSARWEIASVPLDLARDAASLEEIDADGIAAAAFFDLVSADWLQRFADLIGQKRVPLLAVLTVDGRRSWQPPLTEDAILAVAIARQQQRDQGFGPALGGAAPEAIEEAFTARGFRVETAATAWRLGAADGALLGELIRGEARAAREAAPEAEAAVAAWEGERRALLAAGRLGLTVGHCDQLALPA